MSLALVAAGGAFACDADDTSDPEGDLQGPGGKADDNEAESAEETGRDDEEATGGIDLVAWAAANPSLGSHLGDWANARRHGRAEDYEKVYAAGATLTVMDAGVVATGPEDIRYLHDDEYFECFVLDRELEHVWGFVDTTQQVSAVVERVSGTLDPLARCPLVTQALPEAFDAFPVSLYRLVVTHTSLQEGGKVVAEVVAYDDSAFDQIIAGMGRAAVEEIDFGEPTVHMASASERARHLAELAEEFDAAFASESTEATAAFLSDAACEGPCVTDFTLPTDLNKAGFSMLLDGFYAFFQDVHVNQGGGQGGGHVRTHLVGTHANEEWVLDGFQWSAAPGGGEQRITVSDYVLLQFEGDEIVRSITFKNAGAMNRQLMGG